MTTNITPKERQYPAYKSSGSRLLGNVPDHWGTPRLKKHLLMNNSGVWSDEPDDEGTIVIRSTEQTVGGQWHLENPARLRLPETQRRSATLERSDLVITKSSGSRDHIGKTTIVTDEIANLGCCFSNFMQRIKVDQHLDPNLLWRYLNNYVGREQLLAEATTTTGLANLNAKIVGNCRIPVPPPDEQASIVRFLDHADEQIQHYIAGKKRLIALLEEERQALVHQAVTRGLDPSVQLKPSGVEWMGEVPEHWEVVPFKRRVGFREGPGIMAADFRESGVPLLRISCLCGPVATLDGCNYLDPDVVRARWSHFAIKEGDYLLSASASTGVVSLATSKVAGCVPYTGIIRLWSASPRTVMPYVRLFLSSRLFLDQVDLEKTGVAISHFGPTHLSRMVITLPPEPEQQAIVEYIDKATAGIDAAIARARQQIELVEEYRTRLIADVVTGQLDVRKAAAQLPAAP